MFAFISAGINALKTVARTTYNAKLPGSSQTGGQACSTVNQCFKEGTLVETEEGLKPIEEIAVGDKVLAFDETTGEQAYKPVVQLFRNTTKEWYHIHVNGEEIICTGGHPFYVLNAGNDRNIVNFESVQVSGAGKWICAREMRASDKVMLSDGSYAIIEAIEVEKLAISQTTYNFEVVDFHTYYVSDSKVLVHNMCNKELNEYSKQIRSNKDVHLKSKDDALELINKKFSEFPEEVAGHRSAQGWHFDVHPINGGVSPIEHINIYSKVQHFRVHITWG